ncbi:hypothetical protein DL763_009540 [Monosporascus cannonballus]|nr:hypothetical protein DL763_009540 [Monosporascus cannonballus]
MAAPLPSMETRARVASEAAQSFVEHYYEALNRRHNLAPFYASTSGRLTAAGVKPDISINGNLCETVAEYEGLLNKQGSPVHCTYEIHSFDAHAINPHYTAGLHPSSSSSSSADPAGSGMNRAERKAVEAGDRVSVAVQVSGTARYGKAGGEATTEHAFTEAWLLVPHWEAWARNAPRGLRRWVAVSQNFRTL